VLHGVFKNPEFLKLTPAAKFLYVALCRASNRFTNQKNGWFHCSIRQLAKDSGMNTHTIRQAKQLLIDNFFIETLITADYNKYQPSMFRVRDLRYAQKK